MLHHLQRTGTSRIQQYQIEPFPRPGHADDIAAQVRLVETGVADTVATGVLFGARHHGQLTFHPHHFAGLTGQRQGKVADATEKIEYLVILARPKP